jgi:hypothetical protein
MLMLPGRAWGRTIVEFREYLEVGTIADSVTEGCLVHHRGKNRTIEIIFILLL